MLPRFLEHRVSPSLPPLHRWQVLLMSVATGVAVASNYYAQPLLHTIADAFGAVSYTHLTLPTKRIV